MSRWVAILAVLLIPAFADAQSPFVTNVYVPVGEQFVATNGECVDIPSTVKTVDAPSGTAFITWTLQASKMSLNNRTACRIHPVIGDKQPDVGTKAYTNNGFRTPETFSGTWVTETDGGTMDVKLQVCCLDVESPLVVTTDDNTPGGSLTWTLIVFPDRQGRGPRTSGFGILVLVCLVAAGMAWKFRNPKTASRD